MLKAGEDWDELTSDSLGQDYLEGSKFPRADCAPGSVNILKTIYMDKLICELYSHIHAVSLREQFLKRIVCW